MKILILHDYLVLNGATKVLVDYLKILNNLNYEVTLLIKYDLEEENNNHSREFETIKMYAYA